MATTPKTQARKARPRAWGPMALRAKDGPDAITPLEADHREADPYQDFPDAAKTASAGRSGRSSPVFGVFDKP